MKIAKAHFVSPDHNFWYGLARSPFPSSSLPIRRASARSRCSLYYALWLPLVLVDYRQALGNYRASSAGWSAFAVFACLSVFWSAAPSVTARAGVQYLSHIVCALIAARTVACAP